MYFVGEELCVGLRAAHAWHGANKTNRETPPLGKRSPHTHAGLGWGQRRLAVARNVAG